MDEYFKELQLANERARVRLEEIARANTAKDDAPIWRTIQHTHTKEKGVIDYYDKNARPYYYRGLYDVSGLNGFETANFKEGRKIIPYIYPIINGEKKTEFKNRLVKHHFVVGGEEKTNCRKCFNLVRERGGQDWAGRQECVSCFSFHRKNRDSAIKPVKVDIK